MQRRVERWKAEKGIAKEVMFPIRHEPGEMGLSDFTHLKNVEVTVAGKLFHHLLYHYRSPGSVLHLLKDNQIE